MCEQDHDGRALDGLIKARTGQEAWRGEGVTTGKGSRLLEYRTEPTEL